MQTDAARFFSRKCYNIKVHYWVASLYSKKINRLSGEEVSRVFSVGPGFDPTQLYDIE